MARFRVGAGGEVINPNTVGHSRVMQEYAERHAAERTSVAALLKPSVAPDEWEEF